MNRPVPIAPRSRSTGCDGWKACAAGAACGVLITWWIELCTTAAAVTPQMAVGTSR
ncbi:hypothetical protein BZL29_3494 [Mycobacterium kansasii]|uniref:Uncharacterized protein n=1 Tax=Mycobacterium kansasii TaxID=1768 RepID=A0A1V3XC66_MYCKA|nr:hypothetical protein BZL29_3494 [Mycobacterium kansasii]